MNKELWSEAYLLACEEASERQGITELVKELEALGGVARASAKFHWSRGDGQHSISLDVVRPLRIV